MLCSVYDRISSSIGVLTSMDPGVALTILDRALNIQVTYGAVMLSFLGVICIRLYMLELIDFTRGAALGNGICGIGRSQGLLASRSWSGTSDLRLADART